MIADHPIARELFGTFQYLNPGTIHWGEGCVARLEGELSRVGAKRVFLITTGTRRPISVTRLIATATATSPSTAWCGR